MSDCIRGCVQARKHQTECPDRADCKGCAPRYAGHGLLCFGCHVRLADMLRNAPGQHTLLKIAQEPSMSQVMKGDADMVRAAGDGVPSALNVAAASSATDLTDILSSWVEMICEQYDMRGPTSLMSRNGIENPQGRQLNPRWSRWCKESIWCDPPIIFEIHTASLWLLAQIERLERCAGIGDLWTELAEVMSQSHSLAPWREQVARLKGIECPECHAIALARYGGDEHVTCQRCNAHVEPGRYAIWVRQLTAERERMKA